MSDLRKYPTSDNVAVGTAQRSQSAPAGVFDLRRCLEQTKAIGQLIEVEDAALKFELGAITDLNAKRSSPALLFKNFEGYQAFLSGDYADYLRHRGEAMRGWARLNNLAHGDLESLCEPRRPFAVPKSGAFADWLEETWRSAQGLLANELLELVDNEPGRLSRVQQTVLVPLEFELMQTEAESTLTALELVQSTRAALNSSMS
jgi:hypothetical protein